MQVGMAIRKLYLGHHFLFLVVRLRYVSFPGNLIPSGSQVWSKSGFCRIGVQVVG